MGMRKWAAAAASGVLIIAAAGCSGNITTKGFDIENAEDAAAAALTMLKEDNAEALGQEAATLSPDAGCFYLKEHPDAEEVTESVACGPIRRLGVPVENAWDHYELKLSQTGKGKATAEVEGASETGLATDTALMVPAGGGDPAAPDSAPEPQAPPTDVTNRAVRADELSGVEAKFTDVEEAWTLKTPAVNLEVTAVADLDVVPQELLGGTGDGDGEGGYTPPYFAPAEGQQVKAFRVKVGPTDMTLAPSRGGGWGDSSDIGLDTQFTVDADGQKLSITSTGETENPDTWQFSCSSIPCSGTEPKETILLATTPKDQPMLLSATVNGEAQSLDLSDGSRESKVATVDYERSERTRDVNEQLKSKASVKTDAKRNNTYACTFMIDVTKANLSAFDSAKGWAPAEKAWLSFELDNFDRTSGSFDCGYFKDAEFAKDMTLTLGKDTVKASHADDHVALFEVPATVTDADLQWVPAGNFSVDNKPKFKGKPAHVKVSFPK